MPKAGSGWSGRKIWSRTKRFRPPLLTRELGWVGRWEVWSDCDNVIMSTFCAWIICDGQLMVIFAWRPRGAQWNGERGWWWDLMMLLALWHFGVRAGSAGWPFDYTLYIYCTPRWGPGPRRWRQEAQIPQRGSMMHTWCWDYWKWDAVGGENRMSIGWWTTGRNPPPWRDPLHLPATEPVGVLEY